MVEALDTEIGRLLQAVDLATTTVIFVGDNGTASAVVAAPYDPLKAKGEVYQAGVQVPLLIAGQAVRQPGRAIAALVQTTDLFPTILQLAGIEPAHPLLAGVKTDGISLMPYLQNRPHPAPRRWLYAERFQFQFDGDWHRSIRNSQFALIERHDGSRELYNLQLDPLQLDDLITRSLAPEERRALTWLDSQLDAIVASR
jgi:arylsulfatase A-like enzyme